jgi:hypothetical protein
MKKPNPEIDKSDAQDIISKIENDNLIKKTKFFKKPQNSSVLGKKRKILRNANSLEEITKKFIKYISTLKEEKININNVVKALKIKKRRIYDITNVLEGK